MDPRSLLPNSRPGTAVFVFDRPLAVGLVLIVNVAGIPSHLPFLISSLQILHPDAFRFLGGAPRRFPARTQRRSFRPGLVEDPRPAPAATGPAPRRGAAASSLLLALRTGVVDNLEAAEGLLLRELHARVAAAEAVLVERERSVAAAARGLSGPRGGASGRRRAGGTGRAGRPGRTPRRRRFDRDVVIVEADVTALITRGASADDLPAATEDGLFGDLNVRVQDAGNTEEKQNMSFGFSSTNSGTDNF